MYRPVFISMQYYPAKILLHFKSSKVKIAINNKYIINYKIKYKNNASLVLYKFKLMIVFIYNAERTVF